MKHAIKSRSVKRATLDIGTLLLLKNSFYIIYIHCLFACFKGNLTGLFGDNDGIKDNDLVSKHNDVIDGNASTSDIHHKFGLSCKYPFASKETTTLHK